VVWRSLLVLDVVPGTVDSEGWASVDASGISGASTTVMVAATPFSVVGFKADLCKNLTSFGFGQSWWWVN
jgi:hypothetical protein